MKIFFIVAVLLLAETECINLNSVGDIKKMLKSLTKGTNSVYIEDPIKPTTQFLSTELPTISPENTTIAPTTENYVSFSQNTTPPANFISPEADYRRRPAVVGFPVHFSFCENQTVGDDGLRGRYFFPRVKVSSEVHVMCKYGPLCAGASIARNVVRECAMRGGKPTWSELDLSMCRYKSPLTAMLQQTTTKNMSMENVVEITRDLAVTINNTHLTSLDARKVSQIAANSLEILTNAVGYQTPLAETVVENIIESMNTVIASDQGSQQTVDLLDEIGEQIDIGNTLSIETKNLAYNMLKTTPGEDIKIAGVKQNGKLRLVRIHPRNKLTHSVSILIPKSALAKYPHVAQAYAYALRNDTRVFRQSVTAHVISVVISASLSGAKVEDLEEPVEVTFNLDGVASGNEQCRYWKTRENNTGVWASDGCKRASTPFDTNTVICQCNHMTSFALILDVEQDERSPRELELVTWVGCWVSVLGLGLTLVTFLCFRKLRRSIPSRILICLCVSLLLLLGAFMLGVRQSQRPALCHVSAGVIHYFTLTSFMWMLVEALSLYRSIVLVFTFGNENKFFKWSFLYAWGVPIVIAGLTAYLTRDDFTPTYHHQFCTVKGLAFYLGVLLPICITMLVNLLTFIPIMYTMVCGQQLLRDSIHARQHLTVRRAKVSFAIITVMGLNWLFGVLAIGELRIAFQWAFCILNSLQGFFIFVCYVLTNQEAWQVWREAFCDKGTYDNRSSSKGGMKLISSSTQSQAAESPALAHVREIYGTSSNV